jgi:hypothetical protein
MEEIHGSSPWGAGATALRNLFQPVPPAHILDSCPQTCVAITNHILRHKTIDFLVFFNSGTFASVDGSRQPSRIELDIAKHQATCVGCGLFVPAC